MFLALKELMKEKARFTLIVLVIFLVSYLVFFLTSLAYGLATSYTKGLDAWDAKGIALEKDADKNIARSMLSESQYSAFYNSDDMALLGVGGGVTRDQLESMDVTFFGVDPQARLMPAIKEGESIAAEGDVVLAESLKSDTLAVGDVIKFKSSEKSFKVTGFTDDFTFQTQPIAYMSLADWRALSAETSGMMGMRDQSTVSAVVTFAPEEGAPELSDAVSWLSIREFAFALPGYQPQVLTFSLMIGFLIFIAALVLAVFMYILTIQKKSIFGVLKAEGVSSFYIARSVMIQSIILVVVGLLVGLLLALLTGLFLSGKVPFAINELFYAGIAALFVVGALIGSLASVISVSKIDPVEAIQ